MIELNNYKEIIHHKINANKGVRGYRNKLAQACQCHTSFISQVLNSHLHLTPDHAAHLCKFWGLTDLETDYFMTLVDLDRSSSPVLQKRLRMRMEDIKKKYKVLSERVNAERSELLESEKNYYYSSWQIMAIHVCCSIPGKNTPAKISERLNLPIDFINHTLNSLIEKGYLVERRGQYFVTEKDLHLNSRSDLINSHHRNWRCFTMSKLGEANSDGLHYSTLFAMSEKDFEHLQQKLIHFINESREIVKSSNEEELYNLNIDFRTV